MKFSTEDLEAAIAEYILYTAPLRKSKGHDYAGEEDTFSDLRIPQLGCRYISMRLIQKLCRVLNLLDKPPEVKDEPLEREFEDIVNFALYLPILYRQEKK